MSLSGRFCVPAILSHLLYCRARCWILSVVPCKWLPFPMMSGSCCTSNGKCRTLLERAVALTVTRCDSFDVSHGAPCDKPRFHPRAHKLRIWQRKDMAGSSTEYLIQTDQVYKYHKRPRRDSVWAIAYLLVLLLSTSIGFYGFFFRYATQYIYTASVILTERSASSSACRRSRPPTAACT